MRHSSESRQSPKQKKKSSHEKPLEKVKENDKQRISSGLFNLKFMQNAAPSREDDQFQKDKNSQKEIDQQFWTIEGNLSFKKKGTIGENRTSVSDLFCKDLPGELYVRELDDQFDINGADLIVDITGEI
ncbi:MAG: hypothetical protein EZS28_000532 [Streblomastix strix]|uniref:Uncharacterized protein n=1 Tax=Streblomastix strix TaxID=222440 RepID=A0A5J4X9G4_9EUKA|nr:MAG: hypothetical protein EZS28_000532 [Streblomastix strix]